MTEQPSGSAASTAEEDPQGAYGTTMAENPKVCHICGGRRSVPVMVFDWELREIACPACHRGQA